MTSDAMVTYSGTEPWQLTLMRREAAGERVSGPRPPSPGEELVTPLIRTPGRCHTSTLCRDAKLARS